MSQPQHPGRSLFVNIPVEDLERSVQFFTRLGFTFNPTFTDDSATCMLVGEQACFMLLAHERYLGFTRGTPFADTRATIPAMYAFSLDSREQVVEVAEAAAANGGAKVGEPQDMGFMYSQSFTDPDGHYFEAMWMDPVAAEAGPEAAMEAATA